MLNATDALVSVDHTPMAIVQAHMLGVTYDPKPHDVGGAHRFVTLEWPPLNQHFPAHHVRARLAAVVTKIVHGVAGLAKRADDEADAIKPDTREPLLMLERRTDERTGGRDNVLTRHFGPRIS